MTCQSCGATGRTLILTVTDPKGTRRIGTCCWREDVEPVRPAFPVAAVKAKSAPASNQRAMRLELRP